MAMIVSACRTTIMIHNQADFDELQEKLTSTIKAGKRNIHVSLLSGTYIAKEKHITLKDIEASDTKIYIVGKEANLVPTGQEYHEGETYQGSF